MNKILIINLVLVFVTLTSGNRNLLNYFNNLVEQRPYNIPINRDEQIPFSTFFNDEPEKDKKVVLTAFAFELNERKGETGYVISYACKSAKKNESKSNIKKIKDFLIKKKVNPKRLVFLEGGHREKGKTELFIVPEGAIPPKPFPTVPLDEVVIIK